MIIDPKIIEEFSKKINAFLPESANEIKSDFEANLKSLLQATLVKMDVITREEFDVQTQVLAKTREKLEVLEEKLDSILKKTG